MFSSLLFTSLGTGDGIPNHKYYVPYSGEVPEDLENEFRKAAQFVRSGKFSLDMEEQLALYGLYKTATAGHCVGNRPSSLNFEGCAKWDAWNECRGMEKEEAMLAYIELLKKIVPADVFATMNEISEGGENDQNESVFMTDEEYALHRNKMKERLSGIGPPVLSTIRGGDGKMDEPILDAKDRTLPLFERISAILQNDDVEALNELLNDLAGDDHSFENICRIANSELLPQNDPLVFLAVDHGAEKVRFETFYIRRIFLFSLENNRSMR